MTDLHHILVVGQNGLLGRAISTQARRAASQCCLHELSSHVAWGTAAASEQLVSEVVELARHAGDSDSWSVIWAAGAAVPATAEVDALVEEAWFEQFILSLTARLGTVRSGSFVYASSVGGVYGSAPAPFTEETRPQPNSPYGRLKLACEGHAAGLTSIGISVAIARIANLYGPGQRIDKPQGLVTQLIRSVILRQEMSIYVPLETARDYIFVSDAAETLLEIVSELTAPRFHAKSVIKNVCSGRTTSIGQLVAQVTRVTRRRPNIAFGSSPLAARQTVDAHVLSIVDLAETLTPRTTLVEGISHTYRDLLAAYQSGQLRRRKR